MKIQYKGSVSPDLLEPTPTNSNKEESAPSSETSIKTQKDRFYLPVLNINHNHEWPSKPLEQRKHFTDEVATATCLGNCCGVEGLKGACCHLDPYDTEHVLGPLKGSDKDEWIRDILAWFRKRGLNLTRADVVIDYEEGRIIGETLFKDAPNNGIFQEHGAYPMLRFQVIGPRYACKFMNPVTYKCGIYAMRPNMCRTYLCNYVLTNFLVQTKGKPNTWQKVR